MLCKKTQFIVGEYQTKTTKRLWNLTTKRREIIQDTSLLLKLRSLVGSPSSLLSFSEDAASNEASFPCTGVAGAPSTPIDTKGGATAAAAIPSSVYFFSCLLALNGRNGPRTLVINWSECKY